MPILLVFFLSILSFFLRRRAPEIISIFFSLLLNVAYQIEESGERYLTTSYPIPASNFSPILYSSLPELTETENVRFTVARFNASFLPDRSRSSGCELRRRYGSTGVTIFR